MRLLIALAAVSALGLAACSQADQSAAENDANQAATETGQALDNAGQQIGDAAHETGEAIEGATNDGIGQMGQMPEGNIDDPAR
jgi:hypothetical protein